MSNITPIRTVTPARPVDYTTSQLALVRRTVAKDTNSDEFDMFIEVCRRVGLDPFRRQIYCNVYNKDKPDKRQVVFITGIDGVRAVAARNGNYRPDEDEPEIITDDGLKDDTNPKGIVKAVVTVYRQDARGAWHPIKGTARWEEFAPIDEVWGKNPATGRSEPTGKFALDPKNPRSFWKRMPHLMLAKCAEMQALRKGWPEDLSGIYAPEEMAQAEIIDAAPSALVEQEEEDARLARIGARGSIPIQWAAGEAITFVPYGEIADAIMKWLREAASPVQVEAWATLNREGLRQFWAHSPNDALEVKKEIEATVERLSAPEGSEVRNAG